MYNWKVYELAAAVLECKPALNSEANRRRLAAEIQETIEVFVQKKREDAAAVRSAQRERTIS